MKWTPHPFIARPSREQALALLKQGDEGEERLRTIHDERERLIALEKYDPLRNGHELESWGRARTALESEADIVLLLGGNRSGKSEFCGSYVVQTLLEGPPWLPQWEREVAMDRGIVVACFHSSEKSSQLQQQPYVYRYLPPEIRELNKITRHYRMKYSNGKGFSDDMFILPRTRGECLFFNYKQDVSVLEGYEFDLVWTDELVPVSFLEALEFRTASRGGKIISSYTPVRGYSPTTQMLMAGSSPTETRPVDPQLFKEGSPVLKRRLARNCPRGHVPMAMRGLGTGKSDKVTNKAVVFFHSDENVFSPYSNIVSRCFGKSVPEVLIRAYGYTERAESGAFPNFKEEVHVITRERFESIRKEVGGSMYVSADPGGAKNWVVKWYWVTPNGWKIVFREWPDFDTYGPWATPPKDEKKDWLGGPAMFTESGGGIVKVKRRILEAEGWVWNDESGVWVSSKETEMPEVRMIDPRMGGTPAPGGEDETSIIMLMDDEQVDPRGRVIGPSMVWERAYSGGAQGGRTAIQVTLEMLNTEMAYDEHEPVTAMNCPNWYVVEDCQQSIMAYKEFTGMGTDKDALKDVVDPDRYFINSGPEHIAEGDMVITGRVPC